MGKTERRNNGGSSPKSKYLKGPEWEKLIGVVENYRDKLVLKILYGTGMRVGELSLLEINDIDFEERYIHIPAQNTKTRTARTIRINGDLLSDIRSYQKLAKGKKGRNSQLFKIKVRRIQQLLTKYGQKAGIKANPHTLRHTHITQSLMNHVPMSAVQKQVGHKKLTTTQIYADLAPEQVRDAYEKAGL